MKLPAGTSAFTPDSVHLVRDYAEYHATYKFQDGVFMADRRLILKMREVPPSLESDYEAFYRGVTEDENKQANVWRKAGGIASVPTGTTGKELQDAGENALRQRDYPTAVKVFQRLTELEPTHQTAWASLGQAQMATMKVEDAIASFRKQVEVNPNHENAYLMLAQSLNAERKYGEAEGVLKKKLDSDPKNTQARMMLAGTYMDAGKAAEAIPYLEASLKDYPDDQNLQFRLASAYLETKDKEKALPAFEQVIKNNSTPLMKNNIAYAIAEKNIAMDKAEDYARSAVAEIGEHMRAVSLKQLTNDDVGMDILQPAAWDTLGWIYKQEGKIKEAEEYIHAAWTVRQDREVADHLAEIYKLEKRPEDEKKIRELSATLRIPPKTVAEALDMTKDIKTRIGQNNQALQDMRTVKISRKMKKSATGELFLLLSGKNNVEAIQWASGEDKFAGWEETLKTLDYHVETPPQEKTRILRKAVISCVEYNGDCMLVLMPQVSLGSDAAEVPN